MAECSFKIWRHGLHTDLHGNFCQPVNRCIKLLSIFFQTLCLFGSGNELFDFIYKIHEHSTFFHAHFTSEQIHGLDPISTLINRINF